MSLLLRVNLILVCLFTLWYVIRKIRKSQVQIGDTVFWVCFAVYLFILSIFPALGMYAANLLGIDSTVNFVFLSIIFVLLAKLFWMSIQVSQMEGKIIELVQYIALSKSYKNETQNDSKPDEDS